MKSFFIKLLSLILLLAMLMPMVLACKDDPPPDPDDDDDEDTEPTTNDDYYFKLNIDSKTNSTLLDLTDQALIDKNKTVAASAIKSLGGKTVFEGSFNKSTKIDDATKITLKLPEQKSLAYCTSIRFELYSEKKIDGASAELWFLNPKKAETEHHNWCAAIKIPLDFEGWKSFDYPSNQISGYGARDNVVDSFTLLAITPEEVKVAVTNIDITTESYSYIAPEGVDVNDSALYTAITDNVREVFVGNAEVAQTNQYKNNISDINAAAKERLDMVKSYWAENGKEMIKDKMFDVTDVGTRMHQDEQKIERYYKHIYQMAIAWGTIGSAYYKNAEMLEAIMFALDYGYEFYYGASRIERGAFGNWWQWEIGIPMNLLPALAIIEETLTPAQCAKYTEVFDHYVPYPSAKAGNKIWLTRMCIMSAALRRDALDLTIAVVYMNDLFDYIDSYVEDEGGFFEDGSFIQHSYYAYTSGYGGNYMGDLPQLMYYLKDSRFYPQQENVNNQFEWVIDSFRPIIYEKCVMNAMAGRNVGRGGGEDARPYAANMILMHSYAPDKYKAELENMIAYFMQLYDSDFSYQVKTFLVPYAQQLYAKLKDVTVEAYEITRVFGMMARTVHHGPEYGVCLSYSNQNIGKYESINSENRVGWYHGDGMIQIYTEGYSFDGKFYCYANPYLMPGVTANSSKRIVTTISQPLFNANSYAGGVSQGKYGTTGFILDYAVDSHESFENSTGTSISAKKSYFFFDNEVVCMGSDISDSSGTNVLTTLDNRYWKAGNTLTIGTADPINPTATVTNAVSPPKIENYTAIDSRIVHFTNMGYVILPYSGSVAANDAKYYGGTLYYRKATNGYNGTTTTSKDGTYDFLELFIDHGKGDTSTGSLTNNKYFYAYIPNADAAKTAEYNADPDVLFVASTSYVHAVMEKKLGIVAANFFEQRKTTITLAEKNFGEFTAVRKITSESPSSVMITKNADGSYAISISDPTRTYRNTDIEIEIEGITSVVSADNKVSASVADGVVDIHIDSANSLGQTFNLTVK